MSTHVVVTSAAEAQAVKDRQGQDHLDQDHLDQDHPDQDHLDQAESAVEAGQAQGEGGGRGECGCGHQGSGKTAGELPELDARAVPHAIRHAAIFGALDSVKVGGGMVLVAPHDPLPLLAQLERRSPGRFSVDYLERGPDAWRIRFIRD